MGDPSRNGDGTFRKGVSGNPGGRPPRKLTRHSYAQHNARAAIRVAEMPVQMTVDGKVVEQTAYEAMLTQLMNKAIRGDARAIAMVIREMDKATAHNWYHSRLVEDLLQREDDDDEMARKLAAYFAVGTGHGVHHRLADGTPVPWQVYESIRKLEEMDAREAELVERERRLAEREAALATGPGEP